MNVTYYKMKELYKTQKPKVWIVDLYLSHNDFADQSNKSKVLHYSLDLLKLNFNKINAINSIVNYEDKPYYIFKLLYYHSNWKTMIKTKKIFNDKLLYDDNIIMKSSVGILNRVKPQFFDEGELNLQLIQARSYPLEIVKKYIEDSERTNIYILKIIELAIKNNSKVIFTYYPRKIEGEDLNKFEMLNRYFSEYKDVYFLNLLENSKKIGIDFEEDFVDEYHLNYFGASKVTKYLMKYIEEIEVTPTISNENKIWDEAYILYLDYLEKHVHNEYSQLNNNKE